MPRPPAECDELLAGATIELAVTASRHLRASRGAGLALADAASNGILEQEIAKAGFTSARRLR